MRTCDLKTHYDTITVAIAIIGMVFSHALMSLALIMMAIRTVFISKSTLKKTPKDILIVSLSFFILVCLGILWSQNVNTALAQLNKLLPFLVFPLYFFSIDLPKEKSLKQLASLYILTLFVATCIGVYNLLNTENPDYRTIMPYCSHIRFAINLVLAVSFMTIYTYRNHKALKKENIALLIFFILWFCIYLLISASLTGICLILCIIVFFSIRYGLNNLTNRKSLIFFLIPFVLIMPFIHIISVYAKDYFVPKDSVEKEMMIENGHYIYDNVDAEQLNMGLKKYLGKTENDKFESYSYTDIALRYLNSKGLTKDLKGWSQLDSADLTNIKNGIPNYVYAENNPIKERLYKIFFEIEAYRKQGHVKGSSLIQRLDLWYNSIEAIKQNILFGVGTGDATSEIEKQMRENNSQLQGEGLKSHNQYISITLTFGIVGFIIFCIFLFYPLFRLNMNKNPHYSVFFLVFILSMFTEDTFDNQAGIILFCFWNFFFIKTEMEKRSLPIHA